MMPSLLLAAAEATAVENGTSWLMVLALLTLVQLMLGLKQLIGGNKGERQIEPTQLAGLTADTAIPDGVTIAALPEGLRLSGDPTAIGIWLGGQEALALAMAGADGAAGTLRLDLTTDIRTLIRAAVGIELP